MTSVDKLPVREKQAEVEIIQADVESLTPRESQQPELLKEEEELNFNSCALQKEGDTGSSVLPKEDHSESPLLPKEEDYNTSVVLKDEDPKLSVLTKEDTTANVLTKEDTTADDKVTVFKIPQVPQRKPPVERPVEHIHFDKKWASKRGSLSIPT